jgi:hypothetical protein
MIREFYKHWMHMTPIDNEYRAKVGDRLVKINSIFFGRESLGEVLTVSEISNGGITFKATTDLKRDLKWYICDMFALLHDDAQTELREK